jgi:hypothetical protein
MVPVDGGIRRHHCIQVPCQNIAVCLFKRILKSAWESFLRKYAALSGIMLKFTHFRVACNWGKPKFWAFLEVVSFWSSKRPAKLMRPST